MSNFNKENYQFSSKDAMKSISDPSTILAPTPSTSVSFFAPFNFPADRIALWLSGFCARNNKAFQYHVSVHVTSGR